ncbi:MAG TPA: hypothetical protein VFT97_02315 [Candidatus Eisenbacteria bacterium]|nr:hypothetical protein [Candidatus Eisenbacteria bacterium]
MVGERTSEGWQARMRPQGIGRLFPAAFLTFWLCGWAVGEGFALWFLVAGAKAIATGQPMGHTPTPPLPVLLAIGAFLIFWLTLWTVGGVTAMGELLRLLWSEDRIVAGPAGITLHTSRGPFRKKIEIPRDEVRAIVPSARGSALAVETPRATIVLTRNGSAAEREEVASMLRAELGLKDQSASAPVGTWTPGMAPIEAGGPPKGWEDAISPEGERILVRSAKSRATGARVVGVIALGMAALAVFVVRQAWGNLPLMAPAVITTVFALALAWLTFWLAVARSEWKIGSGRIVLRQRFRGTVKDVFEADRLELTLSSDSDGDETFALMALKGQTASITGSAFFTDPKCRRLVDSSLHDAARSRRLGAWLAQAAGIPFHDRTGAAARQADIAALTAQLEASGPLGRFAAKLVTRASAKVKKSA